METTTIFRTRVIWFFTLLFLIMSGGTALAQEPKIRATLDAKGDLWVGQRVTLVVELLAPGFFSSAAAFDLPDPSGLLIMPPSTRPTVSTEEIGGVSYTVQRHEMAVFARRAGEQVIPPLSIRFRFKRHPLDKEEIPATLDTQAVRFTTKMPPGAEKLGGVISAQDLKVEESWKPEPGETVAKTGDAFTRTVTFSASDIPGMAFPPFLPNRIEGIGIYPKPPEVLDHSERGTVTGERRDAITYVCERQGHFVIPAARLTWWDLSSKTLRTIDFPARAFNVASNPAMASAAPPHDRHASDHRGCNFYAGLLAALALNGLACLVWKTRSIWRPVIHLLRPIHLAPLNPGETLSLHKHE